MALHGKHTKAEKKKYEEEALIKKTEKRLKKKHFIRRKDTDGW